jgi:hypothetical protein
MACTAGHCQDISRLLADSIVPSIAQQAYQRGLLPLLLLLLLLRADIIVQYQWLGAPAF